LTSSWVGFLEFPCKTLVRFRDSLHPLCESVCVLASVSCSEVFHRKAPQPPFWAAAFWQAPHIDSSSSAYAFGSPFFRFWTRATGFWRDTDRQTDSPVLAFVRFRSLLWRHVTSVVSFVFLRFPRARATFLVFPTPAQISSSSNSSSSRVSFRLQASLFLCCFPLPPLCVSCVPCPPEGESVFSLLSLLHTMSSAAQMPFDTHTVTLERVLVAVALLG